MEFGLSSEQTLLRDTLDHYLRDHAPLERVRRFATGDEGRARDLVAGLAELGVSALLIPSAHGGIGMTALDACVAAVRAAARPITDRRGTADFRRHVVGVLVRRAIDIAARRVAARS